MSTCKRDRDYPHAEQTARMKAATMGQDSGNGATAASNEPPANDQAATIVDVPRPDDAVSTGSLRVLEFYSGIGGMHYALNAAGYEYAEVLKAFEINDVANAVYAHNFGKGIVSQNNIEALSAAHYNKFRADLWTMSPPCQPYTRQKSSKQEGSQDARAKSFFHLLDVLKTIEHRPKYLLLENVKGFEDSDSRDALVTTLASLGYHYREFLLNPLDFGIPNSRLRYYLVARSKAPFTSCEQHAADGSPFATALPGTEAVVDPRPLREFLEREQMDPLQAWKPAVVWKRTPLFDIVTPSLRRSCCFTKNYFHFAEGTGSVLQENEAISIHDVWPTFLERQPAALASLAANTPIDVENPLVPLRLRYFTPREVANLLCFPADFTFPASTSLKQRYRLLGNSINVLVVSKLMRFLLAPES
ncbi:DNA (cytosine-5-)-methyltransferase [Allomyces macrogynus ATCC 38327]|uniref:tRNA (cytosine(38)-C(5))-methyltransferase n=1 Tax=Allomyces macrogynus (strain ATCC 38327) TaxID=578462 RepID=A0A0L0TD72_ALLM3|nr:DNA (cytosine-5-)-methyltransferase [Allomyces macrogynus ATCC 38327]|eukprot:KNE72464.1 DNA (cytosine-5-)-methyltransferase [Allomyces macrogynus ATCC 38327]